MKPSTTSPTDIAAVSTQVDPKDFPHDHSREKAALGCLVSAMQTGDSNLFSEEEMLQAAPDWFHHPYHSLVYGVLGRLWRSRQPVTVAAVEVGLAESAALETLPPTADLFDGRLYPAVELPRHLREVRGKYLQRLFIECCGNLIVRASENLRSEEVDRLMEEAQCRVQTLGAVDGFNAGKPLRDSVMTVIEGIEQMYGRRGAVTGLNSGFPEWDRVTDGLHPGELIVLAGRPSMGKSILARSLAEHVAIVSREPVLAFTLQTSSQECVQSMICSLAKVSLRKVRDGFFSERDFPALCGAASKLADSKIFLDDTADQTIEAVRAKARQSKKLYGIRLVTIDSLQHIRSAAVLRNGGNRVAELTEVVLGLKAMARELGVPVVVTASVNRSAEERTNGEPKLRDLRDCGSIEEEADVIAFLVRPELYESDQRDQEECEGRVDMIFEKVRASYPDRIKLRFERRHGRLTPWEAPEEGRAAPAPVSPAPVPATRGRRNGNGQRGRGNGAGNRP